MGVLPMTPPVAVHALRSLPLRASRGRDRDAPTRSPGPGSPRSSRASPAMEVVDAVGAGRGRRGRGRGGRGRRRDDAGDPGHPATGQEHVVLLVAKVDDAGLLAAVEAGVSGVVRRSQATPAHLAVRDRGCGRRRGDAPAGPPRPAPLPGRPAAAAGAPPARPHLRRADGARGRGPPAPRRRARHGRGGAPPLLLGADREERDPRRHVAARPAQPDARGGLRDPPGPDLDARRPRRPDRRVVPRREAIGSTGAAVPQGTLVTSSMFGLMFVPVFRPWSVRASKVALSASAWSTIVSNSVFDSADRLLRQDLRVGVGERLHVGRDVARLVSRDRSLEPVPLGSLVLGRRGLAVPLRQLDGLSDGHLDVRRPPPVEGRHVRTGEVRVWPASVRAPTASAAWRSVPETV